jgi:hypothetical protein
MIFNKSKLKTIDGLFIALQETGFVYRVRVEIEENEKERLILRKMKQIWFVHKEQLIYA